MVSPYKRTRRGIYFVICFNILNFIFTSSSSSLFMDLPWFFLALGVMVNHKKFVNILGDMIHIISNLGKLCVQLAILSFTIFVTSIMTSFHATAVVRNLLERNPYSNIVHLHPCFQCSNQFWIMTTWIITMITNSPITSLYWQLLHLSCFTPASFSWISLAEDVIKIYFQNINF